MITLSATHLIISVIIASGVFVFFSGVKDRLKDTHDAHQLIVGMIGLFRAFARHGVLNSLRAIELLDRNDEKIQYNLEKQSYHVEGIDEKDE